MVIKTAQKYIGYLEHLSDDLLGIYQANIGKGYHTIFADLIRKHYRWRDFSGLPWCATFIHAVFIETYGKDRARELLGKPHPGTKVLARRMDNMGFLMGSQYLPESGDLVFFHNGDGDISHCGIVYSVLSDTLVSIEGNTTDSSGHFRPNEGGAVALRTRLLTDNSIVCYAQIPKPPI